MEFKKNIPIYLQIMDKIKQDISTGVLEPGSKLLSTREFAIELKVNPNTISRVYKELETEGIVFTKRGMGTFVIEDEEIIKKIRDKMARQHINNFISQMKELNISRKEAIELLNEEAETHGEFKN